jgi:hypothetical protein
MKNAEVDQTFGRLFSKVKGIQINLAKNGLGFLLGDIFANSSGHPASLTVLQHAKPENFLLEFVLQVLSRSQFYDFGF